ncbi:hypothetical protein [Zhongshania aquimaris]|uniref:DUF1214 domain-containing protein n=1 Tax=Zhongshania aquimaris TaxID=2857107 RepID=A0ABS6VW16_9GAMM|nr:hypothetical protein [Zhongshania aquimaris]MBW2942203.1 hypothetical protein [Zhongshania aquimaris]
MQDTTINPHANDRSLWVSFCERLKDAQATLDCSSSPKTAFDQAEGTRYLSRLVRLGLEIYLEGGDPDFPCFVLPSHATAKLGGDNPDNLYLSATIAGDREYRIHGNVGTVTYLSVGSKANNYSIDGTMASTGELSGHEFLADESGNFEIVASQHKPENGKAWLPLEDGSSVIQLRQTFLDRDNETPASISIERISAGPSVPPPLDPDVLAKKLMSAAEFVVGSSNLFASWATKFMSRPNQMCDWGQEMFIRAGGDPNIFYIHGFWHLGEKELLEITVPVPDCQHWNIQINNWWMESLDYRYLPVCINKHNAVLNDNETVTITVSHEELGSDNYLSTAGHHQGFLLLRWVGAETHPIPQCTVKKIN